MRVSVLLTRASASLWGLWGLCGLAQAQQETVVRYDHPAGATIVHEFRHAPQDPPYRLRFEHALSGRLLVKGVRLVYTPQGQWIVQPSSGKPVVVLDAAAPVYGYKYRFAQAGQKWRVWVTHHVVPVVQPGIATEAEPSVDMELQRCRERGRSPK